MNFLILLIKFSKKQKSQLMSLCLFDNLLIIYLLRDIDYLYKIFIRILFNQTYLIGIYLKVTYLSCIQRASPPPLPLADNHLPFGSIAINAKNGLFF